MRDGTVKGSRLLYRAGVALCAAGVLVWGGLTLRQWGEYRAGERAYAALADAVVRIPANPSPHMGQAAPDPQASAPAGEGQGEEIPPIQVDMQALRAVNPQAVGWLYSPDTVISYPVAQGEDNTYYLKHLFDGTPNSAGCLFLDSRCQGLEGRNSVIYGHYMNNGTLFASLKEYQDQAYYDAHPRLYLFTPQEVLIIELFSAYIAGPEDGAWRLDFSSPEDYGGWLAQLQARSCFESAVVPQTSDRVITLSTCNYTFPNARFVCHGLVRAAAAP